MTMQSEAKNIAATTMEAVASIDFHVLSQQIIGPALRVCHTLGALVLVTLLWIGAVRATSFSTDQSDVWNAIGEPGWAVQLVQRGSTIFATMYVYGQSGQATFYSAALEATATRFTWSGDLIATTGPWFGATPFDPALVTVRKVGTMTWTATTVTTGTLDYSVDGVSVTKVLARYLIRYDDYRGTYLGGIHADVTGCFDPAGNGSAEGTWTASIDGDQYTSISMFVPSSSCTFSGALSQAGQFGAVDGEVTCTNGHFGTFHLFELAAGVHSLTGRFITNEPNTGCKATGYFAAMRRRLEPAPSR